MNHMIHNLTPTRDRGLHHLRPRLHPGRRAGGGGHRRTSRTVWMDVAGDPALPGVRRLKGARRPRRPLHLSRRGAGAARRQLHEEHVDGGPGRRARRHLRPSAPGRPVDRPRAHARRAHRAAVPLGGEVLRAGGRRVVGRRDDRHARRTGASACAAATCSRSRPPTTPSGRPGTSRWGSCPSPSTRAAPAPTRSPANVNVARPGHPRPAGREPQPRRRPARPARPARGCSPRRPRRRAPSPSAASSTAGATSRAPAARAARRSCGRGKSLRFVNRDAKREHLPHDHRLPGALQPRHRASPTRSPTARSGSTPATSASAPRASPRPRSGTLADAAKPEAGTYTYFCRVHPFMRGAFRVRAR